ncbi:hypothetical protein T484DRAFT_1944671 [Baffinella frigidus]|nr:hypothetical protein T484DRAFT_1944671 [Cryptophyta sp. CCMP2293]|mmetsp:Transcript_1000/g.2456  ORF Transcript_1000/g.2456 Transcript_1000/m.2456 type:complete len:274 (+) Transcript_1000:144-965(+)
MAAPAFDVSSLREAFRSKDTLIARLNALLDAVEAAKDSEARETALEAWAQEKSGIASQLGELVESKVGKDITKPLEDAGVGAGTRTSRDAPLLRRTAREDHAAPARSKEVTWSLPRQESDVSRAATVPASPARGSSTSGDSSDTCLPISPVEELEEHPQMRSSGPPGDRSPISMRRGSSLPTPSGDSSFQHRRTLELQGRPASFRAASSPTLSPGPTRFRSSSISNTAKIQALAVARASGATPPVSPVQRLSSLKRGLTRSMSMSMKKLVASI